MDLEREAIERGLALTEKEIGTALEVVNEQVGYECDQRVVEAAYICGASAAFLTMLAERED